MSSTEDAMSAQLLHDEVTFVPGSVRVTSWAELDRSTEFCDMFTAQVHDLTFVPVLTGHLIPADRRCRAKPLSGWSLRTDTAHDSLSPTVILATKNVAPFGEDRQRRVVLLQHSASTFRRNLPHRTHNLLRHSPHPINLCTRRRSIGAFSAVASESLVSCV